MPNDTIITVENLGKKYQIHHQRAERYTALRDVIATRAAAPLRALKSKLESRKQKAGNGSSSEISNSYFSLRNSTEEFWALRDVSFEVKQGEVLGIIGRNGAGKTTLLKILSRITDPTEGRVRIHGRVASLLEVGTGFHPELTGRENIFLNGAILGMSRAEIKKKFDEIVIFAESEKFLDTPVKRYSSGMYVRLAFAVAAHLEPEILVVDEVLAVGDAEFQKKCLDKMEDVSRGGRTVLFVSHNLAAVNALCDRAIVLKAGRNILDDTASTATEYYLGSFELDKKGSSQNDRQIVRGNGLAIHPPTVDLNKYGRGDLDLLLTFEVESDEPRTNIGFGLAVTTLTGIVVSKLSPIITNFIIQRMDGRVRIQIRFKEISRYLAGGHYVFDAWLSIPRVEILLYAERIGEFHLPPSDPFGVGAEFKQPENGLVPLRAMFETNTCVE